MGNPDVKLIFGVAGNGGLNGASGKEIKEQLLKLVANLEKSGIPKIKVFFDDKSIQKEIKRIQKQFKDVLNFNVNTNAKKASSSSSKKKTTDSTTNTQVDAYSETLKKIKEAEKAQLEVYKNSKYAGTDYYKALQEEAKKYQEELEKQTENLSGKQKSFAQTQKEVSVSKQTVLFDSKYTNAVNAYNKELKKTGEYLDRTKVKTREGREELENLRKTMKEPLIARDANGNKVPWEDATDEEKLTAYIEKTKNLQSELLRVGGRLNEMGAIGETWWDKFTKAFSSHFFQAISASLLALGTRAIHQVYQNVLELDEAVTNLQIATGNTREETKKLISTYADLAQQLGATVTEVTEAADTWLRQGYDIAEVNNLITYTMMLSKLGQLDSAEAAKALTSAMKGYKVEVEDAMAIVDKFTAVDMEAAISAGDIATAMAETATSADIAGVSMDKLIGYIATVGEVTQDGAESIGTFYKTMFARMGSISSGTFIDSETGESFNDVDKVLKGLGISLKNDSGEFRNFSEVLDEVAGRWDYYTNVQQHALATAFAGTRQQEKFIVLMENYGTALDYAATAADSAGTAQEKYQEAYSEGIQSSLNKLEATWQEFSTKILDSDLVKGGVDFINLIASLLNKVADIGDGMLITIPAIAAGLALIYALIIKIKGTAIVSTAWTALKGILAVFPALIAMIKRTIANWIALASAHKGAAVSVQAYGTATKAATAANTAFNATNPVGWLMLAATAIYGVVKAISSYSSKTAQAAEASKKAQEAAEEAKEKAEEQEEATKTLIELIEQYREAVGDTEDASAFSADIRQKVLEIQKEITKAVGEEASSLDLVNDSLSTSLKKLQEVRASQSKTEFDTAYGSYTSAKNSSDKASVVNHAEVNGFNWFGLIDDTDDYELIFQRGNDGSQYADEIASMLQASGYFDVIADFNWGDKYYSANLYHSSAEEAVAGLTYAIDKIIENNWATGSSDIFNQLLEMRDAYQNFIDTEASAAQSLISATVSYEGWNFDTDLSKIDTLDKYNDFRNELIDAVKNNDAIKDFAEDADVVTAVDNWLSLYFSDLFTERANQYKPKFIALKSYLDILEEIEDEYDAISGALDEMEENGILSGDTIRELTDEFPDLMQYLEEANLLIKGADGYTIAEGAMDSYVQHLKDEADKEIEEARVRLQELKDAFAKGDETVTQEDINIAEESLSNAIANRNETDIAINTLIKSSLLEDYQEMLEAQSDALDDQLDKYKDIIDIRKELLETYKDELDYQKELKEKQNNVADLQTRLKLAQLDKSASGQAKVRELQEELDEAQEELSEYTLEHAIEDIQNELDNEYDEYSKLIGEKTQAITDAINKAPKMTAEELRQYLKAGGETPKYHSGGFVGNFTPLKSNEEFAKLLNGELVVTPVQMSNFMNKTLPSIASGTSGVVNYNSPLITIQCDSVTKDSLPGLEKIVNSAVKKIKSEIDSKFNRSGKKGSIDAFVF